MGQTSWMLHVKKSTSQAPTVGALTLFVWLGQLRTGQHGQQGGGGCLSHSTFSNFPTIFFFFSFLVFLFKLAAAQLILFLWKSPWHCDSLPVVEKKPKRVLCSKVRQQGVTHISSIHDDLTLRHVLPCSIEENDFPFLNCRKSPFSFKEGSWGGNICALTSLSSLKMCWLALCSSRAQTRSNSQHTTPGKGKQTNPKPTNSRLEQPDLTLNKELDQRPQKAPFNLNPSVIL